MKLTKETLKRIIKEELDEMLKSDGQPMSLSSMNAKYQRIAKPFNDEISAIESERDSGKITQKDFEDMRAEIIARREEATKNLKTAIADQHKSNAAKSGSTYLDLD